MVMAEVISGIMIMITVTGNTLQVLKIAPGSRVLFLLYLPSYLK